MRNIKIGMLVSLLIMMASPAFAQEAIIILDTKDTETMLENVKYIESMGGRMTHRFPPNALIGDIPEDKIASLIGSKNIKKIEIVKVDISSIEKYGNSVKVAVNIWNHRFDKNGVSTVDRSKLKPLYKDMLIVPKEMKGSIEENGSSKIPIISKSRPYGAGFWDTSEYFIGDITVGIVFLESNGVIDPNTEDWTWTEENNVQSEIFDGLNWWANRDPRAKLSFTYNIYLGVPTKYEPISHPQSQEYLWINDAMTYLEYLGYPTYTSYFDNVHSFNNYLRDFRHTDWAYTFFIVDSSNDIDGRFADGQYSAYAYLGGPFVVMTYDNDGYGIDNMDYVAAHETGHIFYATDEYNGYTEFAGYLNAHDIEGSGKIMDCALCWVNGYSSGTALQLGWRDSNGDGVFDIIDFYPKSTLGVYSPDPTTDNTPTYTGTSLSNMVYPNNNPLGAGNDITVNRIDNIQYRIDSGTWVGLPVWSLDSAIEPFTFTTSPLSLGTHKIEVRAHSDHADRWETTYSSDILTITGTSVNLLKNPGFEEIYNSMPRYWSKYQSGTKGVFTYPEAGRVGGKSVAIKYATREIGKVALWRQSGIVVTPSKQYKLSGYMKLSNVIGSTASPRPGGASIRVSWYRSDGGLIKTDYINKKGTIGWTKYEKILTAPSNAIRATVGGDLFDSSGKVWFDDLSFIRIS